MVYDAFFELKIKPEFFRNYLPQEVAFVLLQIYLNAFFRHIKSLINYYYSYNLIS